MHGPAIDQILADEQISTPGAEGDVLWPLTDHLGTVRDLAEHDDSTGVTSIANHIVYNSFGEIVSETNAAVDHIFGYTGRETDAETDLYFYRARYYDPAISQFLSEDPIGFEAGDANTRRYVSNSPTTSTDPSGLTESELQSLLKRDARARQTVTTEARRVGVAVVAKEIAGLRSLLFQPGGKQEVANHIAFMDAMLSNEMRLLDRQNEERLRASITANHYLHRSHGKNVVERHAIITGARDALMEYDVEQAYLDGTRQEYRSLARKFDLPEPTKNELIRGLNGKAWAFAPAKFVAAVAPSLLPGVGEVQDYGVAVAPDSTFADRLLATGSLYLSVVTVGVGPNYAGARRAVTTADTANILSWRITSDATAHYDEVVEFAPRADGWSRVPKSLQDKMTLEAAKKGAGRKIIDNLGDPKFKGMEKWEYKVKSADGLDSVVHYVRDPKTGKLMDFKFKKHSTDAPGIWGTTPEPSVPPYGN